MHGYDMRMHRPPEGWEIISDPVYLENETTIWVCARV